MSRLANRYLLNAGIRCWSQRSSASTLIPVRSISRVVATATGSGGQQHQPMLASNTTTSVTAKRFAANNSPQIDDEFVGYLKSEIELEKKANHQQKLPSIKGWSVQTDGSNVILTKKNGTEEITVRANVNHAVESKEVDDTATAAGGQADEEQMASQMVCRPDFAVEIKRGGLSLGINCSFVEFDDDLDDGQGGQPPAAGQQGNESLEDQFQINEFSLFEGEFNENSYLVSGDVMDGSMYDLMMDLLHERGIDHDFARSLIDYTTVYDHQQYVGLLEKLQTFLSKK
ncbi:conserved regulator of innate immunity protein 3-like [Oppia nitens]|uniref:conserved regulator of innate immunity protein 3-like n=1 Tax=Oppia nitens TaxID=1686743 RepID=UPI0023DB1D97|nr:conserved regulator of innate immunity protein 3-like [Oppia nitens]